VYISGTNWLDVCRSGRCHHAPKVDDFIIVASKGLAFYGVQLF
jgi:hypothetical protein